MIAALDDGEQVEADRGYKGEPLFIRTPYELENCPVARRQSALVRARHETVNKRFKQFECLKRVYRHDLEQHTDVFRACAVITQLAVKHGGEPLFEVLEYDYTL